jgi:hypothetical protein
MIELPDVIEDGMSGRNEQRKPGTGAAMLAADPGWKSRRWNRPVATVVISGNGEGDRTVESPEVKVSVREANNPARRNNGEPVSPDIA